MDSNKTEKQKRINIVIYGAVFVVVAAIAVVAIVIMFNFNSQTPAGTVQFVTNPSVTLVINDKDRVIAVKYDNQDAETLLSKTNLLGKTIDESAQIYARLACEAGFIDTSSNSIGQKVEIIVSNLDGDYVQELETRLVDKMNDYFDNNGVIAGAVSNAMETLKSQADSLGVNVNKYIMVLDIITLTDDYTRDDLAKMNEEELLNIIKGLYSQLKDIAYSSYNEYLTVSEDYLNGFNQTFNTMFAQVFDVVGDFKFDLTIDSTMDSLIEQIENSTLSNEIKSSAIAIMETLSDTFNDAINQIKESIKIAQDEIEEESKQILQNSKNLLESRLDSYQKSFEDNLAYFKSNQDEINQKIKAYRESLSV